METAWFAFAVTVLPIAIGIAVVVVARGRPRLGSHPFRTAAVLYVALVILVALATPGSDLTAPVIGDLVSLGVAVVIYIALRRRNLRRHAGWDSQS